MPQATLRTARLVLEPLADGHLELEVELDADPEVTRYITTRPRAREVTERMHHSRLELTQRQPGLGFWVGLVGGEPIGWWLLRGRDPGEGEVELGYRLLPRFWRRGLAREGAHELVRHAFDDLGRSRVFAETMVVNTASRATMAAVGLRPVRMFSLDDREWRPGAEEGGIEYAIDRADWSG